MVRLVFRPYTQIWRTICTSVSLRASTRVSSGFTLFRHSSPSFGSQQICSYSNLSQEYPDRSMVHLCRDSHLVSFTFITRRVCHPNTRIYVRLLGPCFKTGRLKPFRQHPKLCEDQLSSISHDTQISICPPTSHRRNQHAQSTHCNPQSTPQHDSGL